MRSSFKTTRGAAVLSEFADLGDIHDARLGVRWDRAQLASEVSNRATAALAAAGISPGSTLIIAHAASAGFFADLFAAWSLGCTAACIDPGLTSSEIATLVAFIEPSAILVAEPTGHAGTGVPTFDLSRCSPAAAAICTAKLDPARAALILFTSGTTGQPKGVVLSFRALLARVHLNRAAMGATSQMRTLLTLPTSFGHGLIGNALTPLLSGGEIVLHATGLALAQNLARIIDEYRIGFLSSVPSRAQLDSLRQIWFAGSVPTRVLLEAAMTYLCNNILCRYAASETGLIAQASARELLVKPGLVGRIVPGVEVAIFDAAGVRCLPGKAGVIKVRADSYDGTISHDQTHWVDLGDIGWIDEDNKLYVLGRSADLSVMQADFSPLYEIEHTLRLEWDLADAAAVLVKDAAGDAGPQLWIGVVDNKGATAEKLAAILRRRGLSYDVKLFDVQIIPRGANGKVNRQQLELLLRNAAHLNIG